MKPKELMIGDWVCYDKPNNYCTKVEEIRCTSDGKEYYIRCHRDKHDAMNVDPLTHEDFSVDIIHPIPLSPEILEENFLKNFEYFGIEESYTIGEVNYGSFSGIILLEYREGDGWLYTVLKQYSKTSYHYLMDINYVHELQHVLRIYKIEGQLSLPT